MDRKRVQEAGKFFGVICKHLGALCTIVGCALAPNEDTIVTKGGLIVLCISLPAYLYGAWRTGSWMIDIGVDTDDKEGYH